VSFVPFVSKREHDLVEGVKLRSTPAHGRALSLTCVTPLSIRRCVADLREQLQSGLADRYRLERELGPAGSRWIRRSIRCGRIPRFQKLVEGT